MTTRLVLSMEASVAEKARRVSRRRHTSISALFASYIDSLDEESTEMAELPPITRHVLEMGKKLPSVPADWDYRTESRFSFPHL